ncbi:MAG: hypothetical protein M5R36_12160 [Deltaproteobacteria bacterium]|nr:hypothetical protein [Deltaproteobacteria bacterium]
MRKRVLWCVLIAAIATAGYSQFACEEAAKALENAATNDGVFCLDDVLELAGTSREELGPAADAVVREALAAQKGRDRQIVRDRLRRAGSDDDGGYFRRRKRGRPGRGGRA